MSTNFINCKRLIKGEEIAHILFGICFHFLFNNISEVKKKKNIMIYYPVIYSCISIFCIKAKLYKIFLFHLNKIIEKNIKHKN